MIHVTKKRFAAALGLVLYAGVSAGCNSGELPSAATPAGDKAPPAAAPQGQGEIKARGKAAGTANAS